MPLRRDIAVASDGFDPPVELPCGQRPGFVEHQVLEEMGHPGLARALIAGPDGEPRLVGNDGSCGIWQEQRGQTRVQAMSRDDELAAKRVFAI